jgi:hypothetical protein
MSKSTPSGILGVDMMSDTLDFFKNMWENAPGMNLPGMKHIPGMVMPTLSVDEIDKQIKDLQAVESWLSLNLNMLHTTIQALEVQKSTLSTLQTMGETITAAMQPMSMSTPDEKPTFQSPFTSSAAFSATAAPKAAAEEKPAAHEKPAARKKTTAEKTESSPIQPALDATAAMADAMQPLANPAAWWGMLQDQFKQAVDTAAAMTPDMSAAGTAAKKTTTKSTAKTRAASEHHAEPSSRRRKSSSK